MKENGKSYNFYDPKASDKSKGGENRDELCRNFLFHRSVKEILGVNDRLEINRKIILDPTQEVIILINSLLSMSSCLLNSWNLICLKEFKDFHLT